MADTERNYVDGRWQSCDSGDTFENRNPASTDEALAVANDTNYGLSAGIVTRNHTEANRFVEEVEAGIVKVNEKTTGVELHVPFGGLKDSSSETFREQGEAGMDFYTISKTVYDNF